MPGRSAVPGLTAHGVDVAAVAQALGIAVHDPRWFRQAFAHASYVHEQGTAGPPSNERLEFLGDAVLNLVVARYLFECYPDLPEGELSRLRAAVVRSSTLAQKARELRLGDFVLLGRGEEQAGGRRRPGLLADLFEAVVGAIFLDSGLEAAEAFVLRHLRDEVQRAAQGLDPTNYKALLQEQVQRQGPLAITYEVVGAEGPDHDRTWTCEVRVAGRPVGIGKGKSKKAAQQEAARQALLRGWSDGGSPLGAGEWSDRGE